MPADFSDLLRCPVCGRPMRLVDGESVLRCAVGHRYDAAKQGYFNLLTGRGTAFQADTAQMVQARTDFQSRGHYQPLADAIAGQASGTVGNARTEVSTETGSTATTLVDAGAGTGYYLETVRRHLAQSRAVALDISKYALRRCARTEGKPLSLVCDLWRPLPLATGAVDLVLTVFAPRNLSEFHRILAPNGAFIAVTPLPGHLEEIRPLVPLLTTDADKAGRLASSADQFFRPVRSTAVEYEMFLSGTDIRNAAMMGPSGFHLDRDVLTAGTEDLEDPIAVSARFTVQVFSPR